MIVARSTILESLSMLGASATQEVRAKWMGKGKRGQTVMIRLSGLMRVTTGMRAREMRVRETRTARIQKMTRRRSQHTRSRAC
jgi:hypothetical protein